MKPSRERSFGEVAAEVRACILCERMRGSRRILGPASGPLNAELMFVGEAPGRLGADESAIPFHGDKSGDNFEQLLEQAGLSRNECFVTNAVLCNPRDENGNNSTPTRIEVHNCSRFLKGQVEIVDPRVVVALGAQALNALRVIEHHEIQLATGVRQKHRWFGRWLVPAYHPGQRAMLHRSFLNQLSDYKYVADVLRDLRPEKRHAPNASPLPEDVTAIVRWILHFSGRTSYFRLHKLFYLIEYEHARLNGARLTNSYILRQKDGPYVVNLNLKRLQKTIPDLQVLSSKGFVQLALPQAELFLQAQPQTEVANLVKTVVSRYRSASDAELKTKVYLTSPMRKILRQEKLHFKGMFNSPVDVLNT